MVNNRLYFDTHAQMHAYHKDPNFYRPLISKIGKIISPVRLLDLGCGDGTFIRNVIQAGLKGEYLGLDISSTMLNKAMMHDYDVDLVVADGLSLPIASGIQFDLIHLDSVLHHLIGKTRSQSKNLALNLIDTLFSRLSSNGFVMVEEFCYDSYIIPNLTSLVVFYGLKLINLLKLDLRKWTSEIVPGLEVNFYSESELINLFGRYGTVKVVNKMPLEIPKTHKLFLQKEFGHVSFVIEKIA